MQSKIFGISEQGHPLTFLDLGQRTPEILIVSGLHGDEVEGVMLNSLLVNAIQARPGVLREKISFVPIANPDGFHLAQRWNSNGVDLNRNWPTRDWSPVPTQPRYPPGAFPASEAETRALRDLVLANSFKLVIELHSYKDSVLLPSLSQPDARLQFSLEKLAKAQGIPLLENQTDLGYAIRGGFDTWCVERGMQTLTLEIEKGLGQFAIAERYLASTMEFLVDVLEHPKESAQNVSSSKEILSA